MAKHAGTAHGYARDIGAAKNRLMAGKPRYGKHGQYVARHASKNQSKLAAVLRNALAAVTLRDTHKHAEYFGPRLLAARVATATRRVS